MVRLAGAHGADMTNAVVMELFLLSFLQDELALSCTASGSSRHNNGQSHSRAGVDMLAKICTLQTQVGGCRVQPV
jgi:hypothetical protein